MKSLLAAVVEGKFMAPEVPHLVAEPPRENVDRRQPTA
jgi:hypothetical protein